MEMFLKALPVFSLKEQRLEVRHNTNEKQSVYMATAIKS